MKFRMRGSVFPGDTMVLSGTVTSAETDDTGCGWAELRTGHHRGRRRSRPAARRDRDPRPPPTTTPGPGAATAGGPDHRRTPMDLDFTPEQEMLREAVPGTCARHADLTVVRQHGRRPVGLPDQVLGAAGRARAARDDPPGGYGGTGMSILDGVVVYRSWDAALAPSPHFVSSVMAGGVLAEAGPRRTGSSAGCPKIASRRGHRHPRLARARGGLRPGGVQVRATPDGDGWRLTGVKRHVAFARAADRPARAGPRWTEGPRCSWSTRPRRGSSSPSR